MMRFTAALMTLLLPSVESGFVAPPPPAAKAVRSPMMSSLSTTDSSIEHDRQTVVEPSSDRRSFLTSTTTMAALLALGTVTNAAGQASAEAPAKVLVLGGTGMVGSEVVKALKSLGNINVIATSRDGRNGTVALDFTKVSNVASTVENLAKGCTAVISCVGAIGTPDGQDGVINSASGLAAGGSKAAGVERFVYISVAPEVKEFAKSFDFLNSYMDGKVFSEESISTYFGPEKGILIEPTFIYGGDKFALKPPRVASGYGSIIEAILSSPPLRAATAIAPEGFIKIALEPPVSATTVAKAAIASALGKSTVPVLDTYDKISSAGKMLG